MISNYSDISEKNKNNNSNIDNYRVYFRLPTQLDYNFPIIILCQKNDLVYTLIDKFRIQASYYDFNDFYDEDVVFIYNAKKLNYNLTVEEAGILDNSNIFVIAIPHIKVSFKISNSKVDNLILKFTKFSKISELVESFLDYSGLNRNDIIRFEYNSNILNEDKNIKEEGIKNDTIIHIITKNNIKLKTISVFITYYDKDSNEYKYPFKMECLVTEKIGSLIKKYKNKYEISQNLNAFLNSEELEQDKRIEMTDLSNNSKIIMKEDFNYL